MGKPHPMALRGWAPGGKHLIGRAPHDLGCAVQDRPLMQVAVDFVKQRRAQLEGCVWGGSRCLGGAENRAGEFVLPPHRRSEGPLAIMALSERRRVGTGAGIPMERGP